VLLERGIHIQPGEWEECGDGIQGVGLSRSSEEAGNDRGCRLIAILGNADTCASHWAESSGRSRAQGEGDNINTQGVRKHKPIAELEEIVETKLRLISEIARKDKKCRFSNLAHLLNVDSLRSCFYLLKKGKATGIDETTLEDYEADLEKNLQDLVERMKRQAYKPKPVRRVYIPKANGKMRPLGIPSVEDKIVQMGITRILTAIWEEDFLDCSYGFRPKRNCHEALKRMDDIILKGKWVNYIIDADIKSFFDNVDHLRMAELLRQRIADENLIRLILRFLKGGAMEEGKLIETEKGTPQGGILSPVLANIYLHYVLDCWVETEIKPQTKVFVEMVRYADDFVICVQYPKEAKAILESLKRRFAEYGLELAEEKTRIIEYGRHARKGAKERGEKPGTFQFLGFTHYCDINMWGKFKVGRKTDGKKLRNSLKELNQWLREVRCTEAKEWWALLCYKMIGHYRYYGVSGNSDCIWNFYWLVRYMAFKWMNRRSQKKSFTLRKFDEYLKKHPLPKPRICHDFYNRDKSK
jgi:RNA-directed DNA polymerase